MDSRDINKLGVSSFSFDTNQPYYRILGKKMVLLRRALRQKGVIVDVLPEAAGGKNRWVARGESKVIIFKDTMTASTLALRKITNDKNKTKEILSDAGVKVPSGIIVERNMLQQALDWFDSLDAQKAVVKPITGSGGRGVTSSITSKDKLKLAFESLVSRQIILEEHIDGDDHRILVLGGRVIAAMRRWPAHVTGDGVMTIKELVHKKNVVRNKNPYDHKYPIVVDKKSLSILSSQGFDLDSIPSAGQNVFLKTVANIGAGGDGEDVSDIIHPDFIELAEKSFRAFDGVECLGVDLIAEDISKPASSQMHAVIELNANCDIPIHHWPAKGQACDVAAVIADYYFPDDKVGPLYSIRVEIKGNVKKVGYLTWLSRKALAYGVNGYCESSDSDLIIAVFEGHKNAVDSLLTLCASGSIKSCVTSVDFDIIESQGYESFKIL